MEDFSIQRQRELIEKLAQLVAERAQTEASIRSSRDARDATTDSQCAAERSRIETRFQQDHRAQQAEHNEALGVVVREYEATIEAAGRQHDQRGRETLQQAERALEEAQEEFETATDRLRHLGEQAVRETAQRLRDFQDKVQQRRDELRGLERQTDKVLRRRRCLRAARQLPAAQGACNPANPLEDYGQQWAAAQAALEGFRHNSAAHFLASGWLFAILVFAWIAVLLAGGYAGWMKSMPWEWVVISGAVALGVTGIVYVAVRPAAVRQTLDQFSQFRQGVANADKALDLAGKLAAAEAENRRLALQRQLEQDLRQAQEKLERRRQEIATQRETRLKETAEELQRQRRTATEQRQKRQTETNQQAEATARELQAAHARQVARLDERQRQELATSRETFERGWSRLVQKWTSGLAAFAEATDAMNEFCRQRFPGWNDVDWNTWLPPEDELPALRFGGCSVRLDMFEHGIPQDEEMRPSRVAFSLPAMICFADRPSLLLEAWGEGRAVASRALQNVMLRLLTSLPPAKVQFTIIDPVGRGQNFSAFMHLADFDEKLVNHRIWTETAHIQQRLVDLTEHMEDVIQTYLRNEFNSINDYNRNAGEVAEPFHVLVVANFPAGFSDEAAQRLLSIVSSGARCGVYTLMSTDAKIDLPRNFDLADLESNAATLQWNGSRFCWLDQDLKDLPLELDAAPDDERFTEIIRAIGRRAQIASRVEVPFETVIPPQPEWWTGDSRGGIDIALGRAGASKLQQLRLGKGTSQHVLISGKTGSGKSTLLHVLITNAALRYGPEEVQFYLIDFKKGVEFKPYAALRLPHARVVAIESEREFGMSVLERLDVELRQRGDLFRERGVQDIQAFRNAHPDQPLPRVLLIIDEFQEFFVQDDKLAQEAALLLDRLVRQGRAFGIHVLLGSQTLAGAYSLARSTIGQMAVRIALQCSEADSHLILSEDNTAARLLRRPGEAIYNDANGLFEGNHPFQIVWLAAGEQEKYLQELRQRGAATVARWPAPIVFEGNVAPDPSGNALLREAIAAPCRPGSHPSPRAWLGEAVSIKDPTAAAFHRQSGANLLLVGQQEDLALGVLSTCLVSLGATSETMAAEGKPVIRFHVLDGTRPEAADAGFWKRLARELPLDIQVASPAEAAPVIQDLASEASRRQEAGAEQDPPRFLVIFNLPRFRDLRRAEDDFGFSSFGDDKPPGTARQFTTLLRDGPAVGIHTLLWCDTYSNVSRWFDRQLLRDLDQRVLFQMSATDSANLMDSPAASRLGPHRAILFSEEQGHGEKFRPFGLPSAEWLAWIRQHLERRMVEAAQGTRV